MATVYVTHDQVAAIVGTRALAAAAPDPNDSDRYHTATVEEAIDAVSEQVDARLRSAYTIPLGDVPQFLRRAVARIVHDELTDTDTDADIITRRAEAAWKSVGAIAKGELRIGEGDDDGDGAENPRTRQGKAVLISGARAYRRTDLDGVL